MSEGYLFLREAMSHASGKKQMAVSCLHGNSHLFLTRHREKPTSDMERSGMELVHGV